MIAIDKKEPPKRVEHERKFHRREGRQLCDPSARTV